MCYIWPVVIVFNAKIILREYSLSDLIFAGGCKIKNQFKAHKSIFLAYNIAGSYFCVHLEFYWRFQNTNVILQIPYNHTCMMGGM